jgi:hypothetical protein
MLHGPQISNASWQRIQLNRFGRSVDKKEGNDKNEYTVAGENTH